MKMTKHDECVIAHSVYNALSLAGRDLTVTETVGFLRYAWDPATSKNAARVSEETVAAAGEYLRVRGLIEIAGDLLRIPVRDPRTRRGRTVTKNRDRTDLQCH